MRLMPQSSRDFANLETRSNGWPAQCLGSLLELGCIEPRAAGYHFAADHSRSAIGDALLQAVAAALQGRAEIGDGDVHRAVNAGRRPDIVFGSSYDGAAVGTANVANMPPSHIFLFCFPQLPSFRLFSFFFGFP
jgi:hypothetical protein